MQGGYYEIKPIKELYENVTEFFRLSDSVDSLQRRNDFLENLYVIATIYC